MIIPQAIIAQVAAEQIGTHETSNNQGPGLNKYWLATTYPEGMEDRQPWCSAFVSWCVQEADRRTPLLNFPNPPRFPAVSQWKPWAVRDDIGAMVFSPGTLDPQVGDIVVYAPHFSHVGIVESFVNGHLTTVEGNTNDDGSREGYEVLRKVRAVTAAGSFIRLPARALPVSPV